MIDLLISLGIFNAHEFFVWFLANASYWFVFVFMVVESSFIPFPSELVVPPAAYIACTSGTADLNVYLVVLAATAGALVGALINYVLAMWLGRPIVYAFANSRIGHACLINEDKVRKAEDYFDKHGSASTFIGRLVPVVRQLISIPAGLAKMTIWKFCLYTSLGAGVWNCALAFVGYLLAQAVPPEMLESQIKQYNSYLTWIGLGIGVIAIGFLAWNGFKGGKKPSESK